MGRNNCTTNLSVLDMGNIQFNLNANCGYSDIAKKINRNEGTVRKEVKNYSSFVGITRTCGNCSNKHDCHQKYLCEIIPDRVKCSSCKYCNNAVKRCPSYTTIIKCELLKKNHNVCNGCNIYSKCHKVKLKYDANLAIIKHETVRRVSTLGLKVNDFSDEFKTYLSSRIKAGISPDIILNTLPEKYKNNNIATSTLYQYIDKGLLDCSNMDLRNKASRVRYGTCTLRRNTVRGHQLNGRSIEDLTMEERENRTLGIAEFDTVEGIKGGSLIFTIMIPCFSLMLGFKIPNKKKEEIGKVLDNLEKKLGKYFYILFNKIIPDNGPEFVNFETLETSVYKGTKRMSIHYAHSYCSYEKPHIENNHIILRWLIEKGYDITLLLDDNILDIINRLNNYPRPNKDYKTPLQLLEDTLGKELLDLLDLHHIPIEDLDMRHKIIKNN